MAVGFIVSLAFALVVTIFAVQNSGSVPINFFGAQFQISQALVILISAMVGGIIALLIGMVKQIKLSIKLKGANKTITTLEENNRALQEEVQLLKAAQEKKEALEGKEAVPEGTLEADSLLESH